MGTLREALRRREKAVKMEAVYRVLFAFAVVGLLTDGALATQHVVGGSQGWDESTDYTKWASKQAFKVGDQLVFKYTPGLHSVVELPNESAYKNCDVGSALDSMNSGNNVVKLSKAGTRYFACGTIGHCDQGMKVKVTTVSADASSSPGSTPSPSSSSSSSSSPTSTSSSSSSSSPTSTSAASASLLFASMLLVLPLLSASVFHALIKTCFA